MLTFKYAVDTDVNPLIALDFSAIKDFWSNSWVATLRASLSKYISAP